MDSLKTVFNVFPKLETTNYLLREVKEKDCNDIYEIYSDEEVVKYQQIEAWGVWNNQKNQ